MIIFLLTFFVISVILLIPAILLQTSGADNGVFSANLASGAFGAKSNEVLVKFTSYCVAIFICSALLLSIHYIRLSEVNTTSQEVQTEQNIDTADDALPLEADSSQESDLPLPLEE